jgi:hypothetical protein
MEESGVRRAGWLLALLLLLVACGSPSTNRSTAASAPPSGSPALVVVGQPTFPAQTRVNRESALKVTLRNEGNAVAKGVTIQFKEGYFDGFILQKSEPAYVKDSGPKGTRFLSYPDLGPGEEQDYVLDLVAKTAGEYPTTLTISDGKSTVKQFSLKSVVLP